MFITIYCTSLKSGNKEYIYDNLLYTDILRCYFSRMVNGSPTVDQNYPFG